MDYSPKKMLPSMFDVVPVKDDKAISMTTNRTTPWIWLWFVLAGVCVGAIIYASRGLMI